MREFDTAVVSYFGNYTSIENCDFAQLLRLSPSLGEPLLTQLVKPA